MEKFETDLIKSHQHHHHQHQHAPIITKNVKGRNSPWLTREIKSEMNNRDRLMCKCRQSKLTCDYDQFRQQRNKVNKLVRKAKNDYHKDKLKDSVHDPKRFWSTLKNLFPLKEKLKSAKSFMINGKLNSNSNDIAAGFCSFFTNITGELKSKTIKLKNFIWEKPKPPHPKTYNIFRFKPVTTTEVFKLLKNLQRSKACGHDDLPPGFLKDAATCIAKPLCHIVNLSLKSGVVPTDFKIGRISPVFKSGVKQDMNNYRPITVLSACSKIFEKCVHNQLSKYLEDHHLLSNCQFGFRKKRNTELAATLFMDNIRRNMENGLMTGAIFIYLSEAFDSLSHAHIVESLSSYGIMGTTKNLLTDYLFNRKQSVCFNKEMSDFQPVTCGVPQGSILGPLLFLLAFNDVGDTLLHCKIVMYADDTVIFTPGKTQKELETNLTTDFKRVADWMESNELMLNMNKGKTECMLFGTSKRTKDKFLNVEYRRQKISYTDSYKYLGIKLDQTLSLRDHTLTTYKKASGRLYLLKRIRPNLTSKAAHTIYQSMIVPLFTYCSIVTMIMSKTAKEKIKRLEMRASEVISGKRELKTNCIASIGKRRICLQVFDCIFGNVCKNFENYFERMQNNTRNKNKLLRLPAIKLECSRNSFYFNGAKLFNELPLPIREEINRNIFSSSLDKHVFFLN